MLTDNLTNVRRNINNGSMSRPNPADLSIPYLIFINLCRPFSRYVSHFEIASSITFAI